MPRMILTLEVKSGWENPWTTRLFKRRELGIARWGAGILAAIMVAMIVMAAFEPMDTVTAIVTVLWLPWATYVLVSTCRQGVRIQDWLAEFELGIDRGQSHTVMAGVCHSKQTYKLEI